MAPSHSPSRGVKALPTLLSYQLAGLPSSVFPRGESPGPQALGPGGCLGKLGLGLGLGEAKSLVNFYLLEFAYHSQAPPPWETPVDFQVAKLGAREGGAGRGCSGVRPSSPVGAGGRVWRNVERFPGLTGKEAWGATLYREPAWLVKGSSLLEPCSWKMSKGEAREGRGRKALAFGW